MYCAEQEDRSDKHQDTADSKGALWSGCGGGQGYLSYNDTEQDLLL